MNKRNRTRATIGIVVMLATVLFAVVRDARAAASARDIAALQKAKLIYIATVRKDGNQSKAVPVWFVLDKDNRLLIQTGPKTWKAKRIRRGSPALIWIGTSTGPAFIGKAEITTDPAVVAQIESDIPKKYLLARVGFSRPTQEKFASGKICAIRITPERDLPDGYLSHPSSPAPTLAVAAVPASKSR